MQSLRRRFSLRKKKDFVPQSSKPYQWQEDEKKVREGSCSFQVRYLGCTEVFDSRGMYVCEEAVKALKSQSKGKCQRAVLYVSGDALRVVDEISKSMIVDQTIEKVSFCAPDRNHVKGFAYICRDGTTRRWMCHGFLAVKESGERLSHAVGCAFAICLEKKQKRDKETGVTVTFNQSRTSFERTGSFRQTTLTERIADPQSAILAEHVPMKSAFNPFAVQRPHASANLLERQGSFRGFEKLQETSSPFKRTLSLRLNELPSTLQRQNAIAESPTQNGNGAVGGAIPEVSQEQEDSIAQMCQQLTQGLSALTTEEGFSSGRAHGLTHQASLPAPFSPPQLSQPVLTRQHTSPASHTLQPQNPSVTRQWTPNPTSSISTNNQLPAWGVAGATRTAPQSSAGNINLGSNPFANTETSNTAPSMLNGSKLHPQPGQQQQQAVFAHGRSHSIDTGEMSSLLWQQQQHQQQQASYQLHKPPSSGKPLHQTSNGTAASASSSNPWPTTTPSQSSSLQGPGTDPFDVAWAAKTLNKANPTPNANTNPNPFGAKSVKQFEVQL